MNPSTPSSLPIVSSPGMKPVDPDTDEQAVPGHGVPSQDPEAAAQVGLSPEEAARESESALVGGGVVAGMTSGAAMGAVVAGPAGILAGGAVGAIAGAVGGQAAGKSADPKSRVHGDGKSKSTVH